MTSNLSAIDVHSVLAPREEVGQGAEVRLIVGNMAPMPLVADMLGLNPQTLSRYIAKGLIKGKKFGGRWYVDTAELQAVLVRTAAANKVRAARRRGERARAGA